jgi:hypothetical protein
MGQFQRRSISELVGEFLRETGVLVSVFYGLTTLLSRGHEARLVLMFIGTALGLSLWFLGVWVERRRSE